MSEKNNHFEQTAYDEHGFLNVREHAIQFKRGVMQPRLCRHCDDPLVWRGAWIFCSGICDLVVME